MKGLSKTAEGKMRELSYSPNGKMKFSISSPENPVELKLDAPGPCNMKFPEKPVLFPVDAENSKRR